MSNSSPPSLSNRPSSMFFWPTPERSVAVRGEGIYIWDDAGRRYIDACSGPQTTNLGHGNPRVLAAMREQSEQICYAFRSHFLNEPAERLAHEIVDACPEGIDRAFFCSGGSEAVEACLKLARQYAIARGEASRYKVVSRLPSYHGATIATLGIGGHMARRSGLDPLLAEWPKVPWNDASALAAAIEAAGPETVSAFMAEPIIGASAGALVANEDYWQQVMEVCQHYGVLFIADEVMTGFGRTGLTWGHEHDPVQPDILVSAKGLGGGYVPMSMVTASDEVTGSISDAGGNVMFFTYSGPDAMCAGALAVLEVMEREQLVDRAKVMGDRMQSALSTALDGHSRVTEIRGRGLMIGVELTGLSAVEAVEACVQRGMWVYPAGSGPAVADALLFAPPMVVTDDHIDRIVDITVDALNSFG